MDPLHSPAASGIKSSQFIVLWCEFLDYFVVLLLVTFICFLGLNAVQLIDVASG